MVGQVEADFISSIMLSDGSFRKVGLDVVVYKVI